MEEKWIKKSAGLSQVYRLKIIKDKLTNGYEIIKTVGLHPNGYFFKKLSLQIIRKYKKNGVNFELLKSGMIKIM